jgi:hypothetical protein
MANTGPSWSESTVISPVALAKGEVERATLDLRTKFGAFIFLGLGRGGTTALSSGVNVEIRRTYNNDGFILPGAPHFAALSDTVAAIVKLINNGAGYAIGTSAFAIDGTGTPVGDDDLCFWGFDAVQADGTALPNLEFLRVSKFSNPTLTVDTPCKIAKIDNELITNKANSWNVWCPGGCTYEVIFDYGDDANGEAVAVVAYAQIYDKLTKVA